MQTISVIPCLDVAAGRVVKGVNFVELRDAGDPLELAQTYSDQGADELVFLDVTATTSGRDTTYEMVSNVAAAVSIPFVVGGGVRSLADAKKLITSGAKKVSVSSAAVADPELINEISAELGPEFLVVAVDVKKDASAKSGYAVVTHGGQKNSGLDALLWAKEIEQRGGGQILLTSMDADGTQDGFDEELLKMVTSAINIPVIASGGAGKLEHFVQAAKAGARGVLAASVFHNGTFSIDNVKKALTDAGFGVL